MARKHPLLRALKILFISILLFFVGVFFFAYLTGGDLQTLSLLKGESVGVLVVEGAIDDSQKIIQDIKRFSESPAIKAVVLRIESPGGAVGPTQEIFEEIEKLKKKKPVIASLGDIAASGGYYIASISDHIVANPGTITGSIGVIMELGNIEELLKKIGVKGYSIKSGPHKDIGSPTRPLSPEGQAILQGVINNVHRQFIRAVAMGRKLPESKIAELADGRIYSGEQAKQVGLVDTMGNLEDAIDLAAQRVNIARPPQVIYSGRETTNWWRDLFSSVLRLPVPASGRRTLRYEWSPAFLH